METKICSKCHQSFPLERFTFRDRSSSGKGKYYESVCKTCKWKIRATTKTNKRRVKLNSYRRHDVKNGREYSITKELFDFLTNGSCIYCGTTQDLGLDRIDNSIGHIPSNCVPACIHCNMVRGNRFSHQEMFVLGPSIRKVIDARCPK